MPLHNEDMCKNISISQYLTETIKKSFEIDISLDLLFGANACPKVLQLARNESTFVPQREISRNVIVPQRLNSEASKYTKSFNTKIFI